MGVREAGVPHHPTVELQSAHTLRSPYKDDASLRSAIVLSFLFQGQQPLHEENMADIAGGKFQKLNATTHTLHTQHETSRHATVSFPKYFKEMVVNHGWSVTGELQSAGRSRLALVGLVQQAVDVAGQVRCGSDGVVPQNVDHIIQSVKTVLHLRLRDKQTISSVTSGSTFE